MSCGVCGTGEESFGRVGVVVDMDDQPCRHAKQGKVEVTHEGMWLGWCSYSLTHLWGAMRMEDMQKKSRERTIEADKCCKATWWHGEKGW